MTSAIKLTNQQASKLGQVGGSVKSNEANNCPNPLQKLLFRPLSLHTVSSKWLRHIFVAMATKKKHTLT